MRRKSLNQVLAEVLTKVKTERGLTDMRLGELSGVAPNTIGNYCKADGTQFTAKGRERSATLLNVEKIAAALDMHPLALLTDPAEASARAAAIATAVHKHVQDALAASAPDEGNGHGKLAA